MKTLDQEGKQQLLSILKERFIKNIDRHPRISWEDVQRKLDTSPQKLWSLNEMERTGGEPDVIGHDETKDEYIFCDCSPESPIGRRGLCYDEKALEARKANKPSGSAVKMAEDMGIELLDENQYFALQEVGRFDQKTSSWLKTPKEIRDLGGAIFGDYRYGRVFIYHNGAESYYSSRGFRGLLRV